MRAVGHGAQSSRSRNRPRLKRSARTSCESMALDLQDENQSLVKAGALLQLRYTRFGLLTHTHSHM